MATSQHPREPSSPPPQPEASESPLLAAKGVNVVYEPARGVRIWSVRDVNVTLRPGEFVGLVGESGCGKSTLGFALTRMLRPPARLRSGEIFFDGKDISLLDGEDLRRQRRGGFALVLQSGMNTLNPVRTVAHHFGDILKAHKVEGEHWGQAEIRNRGTELLDKVQLDASLLDRYPHELSGGMRQRVSIALALSLQPRMIIFDEPTTALDVIAQKAVMQTIKDLQREDGFTAILISHDLGVVLEATDRVMVMYAGEIVEDQPSRSLVGGAHHPYTEALLRCYADPRAEEIHLGGIPGTPPDLSLSLAGCPFTPRCPLAEDICRLKDPPLAALGNGLAACHVRARKDSAPVDGGVPATVRQPTAQTSADAEAPPTPSRQVLADADGTEVRDVH
ncbi:ABC transporter ATP-binding protein [Rugosimonospora africana]|uniref:Dipeptide/oligopeptide/nickel ABC transporter ATP-binding protein n=1 Tax=Rugosimonospora africana TaxID=556532 RepID=A0A8J3QZU2_9ACTN|nr:ABC transporter ATP-binding protein [Rugosimonospora africana]GIH18923.1 dipeptide/oligopeptide/nickel ABC transporter ATP-binding protein [Rugosimonospora africana]